MFDKLKEGGATNVLLLPSESVEGHYYVFTQVSAALEQLVQELRRHGMLPTFQNSHPVITDTESVDNIGIVTSDNLADSSGSNELDEETWHPEL